MSERSTDLLKYLGGPEKFNFNNTRIEWWEDDPWNRRITLGTALLTGITNLDVGAGVAHRFPVGTLIFCRQQTEFVRVIGHVDGQNLTVTRDLDGNASGATWATTDEVFVAGFAMHENDNWVYRPTSLPTMPFNYAQVHQTAVQVTWRMMETNVYGMRGSDIDHQARNTVEEQFVYIEQEALHGFRAVGTSTIPATMGGIKNFVTAANGAAVTDLSGAALTRGDIDTELQNLYYEVGGDKMARTMLIGGFGKRKISSFFSAAERLGPGEGQTAGVVVDRLNTDFGVVDVLLHTALAQDELLLIRRENHTLGHHGSLGRPQIRQLPPSATGPRIQQAFYADLSMINSGPRAEARIFNFSTTA